MDDTERERIEDARDLLILWARDKGLPSSLVARELGLTPATLGGVISAIQRAERAAARAAP